MDPKTGRTRVRLVDTSTASHSSARALQVRMEQRDLDEPGMLEAIARVTRLSQEQVRERYAPVCSP
jgi:6-phosphofructokinase 1